MNSKTIAMIEILLDGRYHKVVDLAETLEISSRLVRYEADEMERFLTREGFPLPENDRSLGLRLALEKDVRHRLMETLSHLDSYEYAMTQEERCTVLLLLLFSAGRYLTSQYFAEEMGVSKSSVDKDLSLLRGKLEGTGVCLEGKSGKGSQLAGDELTLRRLCLRLIQKNLDFTSFLENGGGKPEIVERYVRALFCQPYMPALPELVHQLEREVIGKWFTYDSLRVVVLSLSVALARNEAGHPLEERKSVALIRTSREYLFAMELARWMEKRFGVLLGEPERDSIAILLAGAKYREPEPYLKEDWAEIQVLLDKLVRAMEEKLGQPFTEDEELYNALQAHLGPAVYRIRNHIPIANPNLAEIERSYRSCIAVLQQVISELQSPYLAGIQRDDIAYLALHFCASEERLKRMLPVSRVAIVCVYGAGTASLLRELVCGRFKNIRVTAVIGHADLQAIEGLEVDFIISSFDLADCRTPYVKVDPIPTAEDYSEIGRMLYQHASKRRRSPRALNLFQDVLQTTRRCCEIPDTQAYVSALSEVFTANGLEVKPDRVQPRLSELLVPGHIRCECQAKNWEKAVRIAAGILEEAGDITEEFTQSAVDSVREAGPYIVICKGVALVHGQVGKGVFRMSMALATLTAPVCFHHPHNDPVRLVLCLAAVDNWSHIEALKGVLSFLERYDVSTICGQTDPEVIYGYLKESGDLECR